MIEVVIAEDKISMGQQAALHAGRLIAEAIARNGEAKIILATGTSQFETLKGLIAFDGLDWSRVIMFHLDEYIGLSLGHQASFRRYLKERFLAQVPPLKAVYLIDGEGDYQASLAKLNQEIRKHEIDVALVGIGENGHLAFNDPPADFDCEDPYLVVNLDEACRMQQMGEGWFGSLEEVPLQAISMSVKQIMKSKHIVCSVPDIRKAEAVKNTLYQEVSVQFPASILQNHSNCICFLDKASAHLLPGQPAYS